MARCLLSLSTIIWFILRLVCSMAHCLLSLSTIIWFILWLNLAIQVSAAPVESPFPDILFSDFACIIQSTFGSKITLATVLMLLFSVTDNPDLFNLHFRQQHPTEPEENKIQISGWLTALANTIANKLGEDRTSSLFFQHEFQHTSTNQNMQVQNKLIAKKLDTFAMSLTLSPYDNKGNYIRKLLPVSFKDIRPALIICPKSFICGTLSCQPRSLQQALQDRDIPLVTFIKDNSIHEHVPVLTGKCPRCNTLYFADHEHYKDLSARTNSWRCVYLNSARYIKIGQSLWVDRLFSAATVNAMYNFHASASAYAEFWNNTYGIATIFISRAQVWQAFVQESIRTIAAESQIDLELGDGLNIKDVTTEAFQNLGENGIIRAADKHSCSECTHVFKRSGGTSSKCFNISFPWINA
jgi:hypothetical protein